MAEIKYSEFDENYYAMVIANPYIDGMHINPICSFMQIYNEHSMYEPKDKSLKDVQFMDFLWEGYTFYISEKIKKQLDEFIPTRKNAVDYKGTMFFDSIVYFKTGEVYNPYYALYTPKFKFIEKKYLPNIDEQHDGTTGLEKITNIVLKPSAIKKVPEEMRTVFRMDFHKVKWLFCLEHIKDKIESANATGIKLVKSKDMDWSYANKK